ncbi:MAG: polysaccharide biosynthesis/export family protein [Kiritimatiellae bacterium]|nr:polysaccharide biosynthesis/export family protein [Kiritimatiellia bacterium]
MTRFLQRRLCCAGCAACLALALAGCASLRREQEPVRHSSPDITVQLGSLMASQGAAQPAAAAALATPEPVGEPELTAVEPPPAAAAPVEPASAERQQDTVLDILEPVTEAEEEAPVLEPEAPASNAAEPAGKAETVESELRMLTEQGRAMQAAVQDEEGAAVGSQQGDPKYVWPGDRLIVEMWAGDKAGQIPGFPMEREIPSSGEIFIPLVGLVKVAGKTDEQIKAICDASFAEVPDGPASVDADTIRPGDTITIQVWLKNKASQFTGFPVALIISDRGEAFIPHLGPVKVAGRKWSDARAVVETYFSKILKEPTILMHHRSAAASGERHQEGKPTVIVRHVAKPPEGELKASFLAQPRVALLGWVQNPGLYSLERGMRVRDLIAKAGGLRHYAKSKGLILVRGEKAEPEVIRINMKNILYGRSMEDNIELRTNDAIYVAPMAIWQTADAVRTVLLPVLAVRDAVWVYDRFSE